MAKPNFNPVTHDMHYIGQEWQCTIEAYSHRRLDDGVLTFTDSIISRARVLVLQQATYA